MSAPFALAPVLLLLLLAGLVEVSRDPARALAKAAGARQLKHRRQLPRAPACQGSWRCRVVEARPAGNRRRKGATTGSGGGGGGGRSNVARQFGGDHAGRKTKLTERFVRRTRIEFGKVDGQLGRGQRPGHRWRPIHHQRGHMVNVEVGRLLGRRR